MAFARAGAHVSICARGAAALEAARAEIATKRVTAHSAACDLADGEAVARYIADAAEALGGIDTLVNNASAFGSTDDEAASDFSRNGVAARVARTVAMRSMARKPPGRKPGGVSG